MGIEPTFSAWEADVLPLNYTRILLAKAFLGIPVVISLFFHHQPGLTWPVVRQAAI